jgi:hypothetical protein
MAPGTPSSDPCPFCEEGRVIFRPEKVAFRQHTEGGYVQCEVTVPVGTCEGCGARIVDERAEAIMDVAARRPADGSGPTE